MWPGRPYVDGLTYGAEGGRDPDSEPGGELGVGVATSQVGEGEQGLSAVPLAVLLDNRALADLQLFGQILRHRVGYRRG